MPQTQNGALANLRVLDLTRALAGPYCTQMLADLGADVLKVEDLDGDGTREVGPFHPEDEAQRYSGYFQSVNRNKKSIAINLKSEAGRNLIFDLIADYDVVVENFRSGVMERLGLSYEALRERNPRLIYAALRGYGDARSGESPYLKWPTIDVIAQAMGGIAEVTGPDADHPTKVGPGVGDIIPGMFLATGILAAVIHRKETGEGQFVDVAMIDSILAITERIVYQRSFGKVIAHAVGNHQPFMGPFGFFPASDGFVALSGTSDHFFALLCKEIGADAMLADPRFTTMRDRQINLQAMIAELCTYTCHFTKAELMKRLGGKIPFGPVYDMAEIAADPHFQIRDMMPEVELDGISEKLSIAGTPIKMSATPTGVRTRAPDLGQHTRAVLEQIGRDDAAIASLVADKVIGLNAWANDND